MRIAKLPVNNEFANYELLFMNISQECKEYASCELQVKHLTQELRKLCELQISTLDFEEGVEKNLQITGCENLLVVSCACSMRYGQELENLAG